MFLAIYFLLQATARLELFLRGFLIVPEIWRRGLRLDVL
jgi:hypothetical protein